MNVLIVGNGFDRKIGLKTDYISFLDWMKEKGSGVGKKFRDYSNKLNSTFNYEGTTRIQQYKNFPSLSIHLSGNKFNIKNHVRENYFDESKESNLSNCLLYVLPEIIENNKNTGREAANIWYCFIQILLYEKKHKELNLDITQFESFLGKEGNWIDIEGLIQRSIEIRTQKDYYRNGVFSVSSYFDVFSLANLLTMDVTDNHYKPKDEIYDIVWSDFLDFKKELCNYLTPISDKAKKNWSRFEASSLNNSTSNDEDVSIININDYEKIINFNYTNFWLENPNVYYVHGNIDDRSNIVFGLDMNIRGGELQKGEGKTTFEISLHKNKRLLKFSKISQLLHLQVDKISHHLNKINQLSIVGHSISDQDYSYYFSILDRNVDNIQLNCLWYDYNNGGTNKELMKEALFEMLTNYEKYSNQKILHKMIFEGRIKFKKVFIPQIFLQ